MSALRTRPPRIVDDVAPTLDALARATAGGLSLVHALRELRPDPRRPFASLLCARLDEHYWGIPLDVALDARDGNEPVEVVLALSTISLLARHGGAAAAALDRAASAVRERRHSVEDRRAQAAQARLSTWILSVLPVGFALWSASSDHRVAEFLIRSRLGWLCAATGIALNASGWFWMRHIIGGGP